MHILTKIFVVLAAVLSLALSALTMMYSVNAETIRTAYEDADLKAKAATTALNNAMQLTEGETAQLRGTINLKNSEIGQLRSRVSELELDNDRLLRDKQRAEQESARALGRIDEFRAAVQTQATVLNQVNAEVSDLRQAELEFQRIRLELEDTIADFQSQVQVLEQTTRAQGEQIAALRQENEQLRSGGTLARGTSSGDPITVPGASVVGEVLGVRTDTVTGRPLVRVSLGSNDRMRENVKLIVYRGGNFVANVVLRNVDLQESIGEVTLAADGVDGPRSGDKVTTRLDG